MKTLAFCLLALLAACGSSSDPDAGQCTPGQSVACVGVGGCQGGQVCQADGQGFGACECGAATSSGSTTSSGAVTSSGASAGSASGSGSGGSIGTTGGGTGAGTTGATTGSTTGGVACAPGAIWVGDICTLANCTAALNGIACAQGDGGIGRCLGTGCIDVAADAANCGTPGFQCASGLSCVGGECLGAGGCDATSGCLAGSRCLDGHTCISPNCTDARVGLQCAGANFDFSGPGSCCGASCVDGPDSQNCGACGVACDPGKFCAVQISSSGDYGFGCTDCADSPDNTLCPSGDGGFCCGGSCQPIGNADPLNCGACGRQCPGGASGTCSNGVCGGDCAAPGCPAGTQCLLFETGPACEPTSCVPGEIGGNCVDPSQGQPSSCCGTSSCQVLDHDPENCGGCGIICGPGEFCRDYSCVDIPTMPATCAAESEGALCIPSPGVQGICCSGTCTDTTSDPVNCGSCGTVCSNASTCQGSSCQLPNFCQSSDDCPAGDPCVGLVCSASCAGRGNGEPCSSDLSDGGVLRGSCCAGACTAVDADSQNCGACGIVCPQSYTCTASVCHQGASTFLCGAPGLPTCPAGTACSRLPGCTPVDCAGRDNGDACALGPSLTGQCCGGQCLDLRRDPSNCGGCGLACPAVGSFCQGGKCLPSIKGLTCTPACPSGQLCVDGQCISSSLCTRNYWCLARDGGLGVCCSGACLDLNSDPQDCGACGAPCPAGETCAGGVCQGDVCDVSEPGFYCSTPGLPDACCGNACIDLSSDAANCGACGNVCAGGICSSGACG